jgi:hypothetical protein
MSPVQTDTYVSGMDQHQNIGAVGFELTTSASQTQRSTKLSYAPEKQLKIITISIFSV